VYCNDTKLIKRIENQIYINRMVRETTTSG